MSIEEGPLQSKPNVHCSPRFAAAHWDDFAIRNGTQMFRATDQMATVPHAHTCQASVVDRIQYRNDRGSSNVDIHVNARGKRGIVPRRGNSHFMGHKLDRDARSPMLDWLHEQRHTRYDNTSRIKAAPR